MNFTKSKRRLLLIMILAIGFADFQVNAQSKSTKESGDQDIFSGKVKIENIGIAVNSKFAEYHPLIAADESVLYFTSRRDNTTGGAKDPNYDIYFEDIYISEKKDGVWSTPVNVGAPLNTNGHDAAVGLSPDGQRMFIYQDEDIYESKLGGDKWSTPVKLNKNVNSKYKESSACYSFDGRTIYFVSDRPGGHGDNDIYKCTLTEKNEWGKPENLGKMINTPRNEDAVFMHPDGKTIYFSSQGHEVNLGGYDIFSSVYSKESGTWSAPKNLNKPINTHGDDVFFVLAANGKRGYYSSVREGGNGEKDIYIITMEETKEKPKLTLVKGNILDKDGKPIEALIEITDNAKEEVVLTTKSNSKTGKFLVSLPSGVDYGMTVTAENHFFHSEHIDISGSESYLELFKNIELKKAEVGESMVLNNIYFDSNGATLKSESVAELGRVVRFLKNNPTLMFEISGHTDNVGTWDYNMNLAELRSEAVLNYFTEHEIDKSRLVYAGYGLDKPVATNDTEEGRQKNRRVEMLIIQKTTDKTGLPIDFKVQVLASQTRLPLTSERFKGLEAIQEYMHKGMYKYAVGKAPDLEKAQELKEKMKGEGFDQAFLVAFYNDQRIAMRTALKLLER